MKILSFRTLAIAAFFLAFGASAFAQLTFNGYYRVGGVYDSNNDSRAYSAGRENLTTLSDRIRLNISYAAQDDMYGFKSRLQADAAYSTSGSPTSAIANLFTNSVSSKTTTDDKTKDKAGNLVYTTTTANTWGNLKYGFGYAKFLDGTLKFSAGKLDVTDYMVTTSTANIYTGNVFTDSPTVITGSLLGGQKGNTTGAMLQVWPIEGLSVAATARTGDGSAYYKTHNYGIDAYYMLPGIGKAILTSNLGYFGASSTTVNSGDSINKQEGLDKSFVSAGFSYTGFPGLTATAAYRYNGYVANDDGKYEAANGAIAIAEYKSGPIFGSIAGDFDLTNSRYYLDGEASYLIIPQVKVRGYFMYANSTIYTYSKINLNGNTLANNSLYGVDVVLPVGNAEASVGLAYADKAKIQIPLLVKANF
jgi:hypothetical protein